MYKIEAHIYEDGSDYHTDSVLLETQSAREAMDLMQFLNQDDLVSMAEERSVYEWSALVQLTDGDTVVCTRAFSHTSPYITPAMGWEDFCQREQEEVVSKFLTERNYAPVQNEPRKEEPAMKKECTNSVKRTRHYTVCAGLVRPDPLGEAVRFEGEVVNMWCDTLQAERVLKRRFKGAPVIIESMDRRSGIYYMDLSRFYELADRFVETDQNGNVCED